MPLFGAKKASRQVASRPVAVRGIGSNQHQDKPPETVPTAAPTAEVQGACTGQAANDPFAQLSPRMQERPPLTPQQTIEQVNATHDACLSVNRDGRWRERDPFTTMGGYEMPRDLQSALERHAHAVSEMEQVHGIEPEEPTGRWGRRSIAVNGPTYDVPLSERGWQTIERTEMACLDAAIADGRAPATIT